MKVVSLLCHHTGIMAIQLELSRSTYSKVKELRKTECQQANTWFGLIWK
jgi:hypothetical protein